MCRKIRHNSNSRYMKKTMKLFKLTILVDSLHLNSDAGAGMRFTSLSHRAIRFKVVSQGRKQH